MPRKAKDWFPNDRATHEWLDATKKTTRATYQTAWKDFIEYAGMSGDEILEDRKSDKDYAWEKRVLGFKRWMIDVKSVALRASASNSGLFNDLFRTLRHPHRLFCHSELR